MSFIEKDFLPFTKKLPKCSKCDGKTKRRYFHFEDLDVTSRYMCSLLGKSWLELTCRECNYRFPQYSKDYKKEKQK